MKCIALCALLCLLPLQAYGWWDTGHMIVAEIALKYLNSTPGVSDDTKAALNNAVNSLVSYSDASNTFVTAACWMDDIKNRGMRQLSNWHYINLPICDYPNSNDTDSCNGTSVESVMTSDDEDVLWAIEQAINTISSQYAMGFERGFAVRNLLHLVGDIHQPLHAVARFSDQTPNGDEGGNLFYITNVPFTKNLHGFWDSGLGLLNNSISRPLNSSANTYLSDMADHIIELTAHLTEGVTTYNVTNWAIESRQIAMEYVYNLTYNSTPSAEYIAAGWPIVEQQLGLAGYRLYQVLLNIQPCTSAAQNCPEESSEHEEHHDHEDETDTKIIIALAIAAGVSVLFNIVLLFAYCRRPPSSEEIVPLSPKPY